MDLLLFCPCVETPGINKKMFSLAHIFRGINSYQLALWLWAGGEANPHGWQGHIVKGEKV